MSLRNDPLASTPVQMSGVHLALVRKILFPCKLVVVFGSRATGTSQTFSDLDLCLLDEPAPSDAQMSLWNEEFENSDLPFVVDLSRLEDLPGFLQKIVKETGINLLEARASF